VLTGAVGFSSKRSLIEKFAATGKAPCSGAERRNKELYEVSTAVPGGAAARNAKITGCSGSRKLVRDNKDC